MCYTPKSPNFPPPKQECGNLFEIKYYLNGVELKSGMIVKFDCCSHYGDLLLDFPIKIINNKLYAVDTKENIREVDDCLMKPLEIVR